MNAQSRQKCNVDGSPEGVSDLDQVEEESEAKQEEEVDEDDSSEVVEMAFSESCCSLNSMMD